MPFDPDRYMAWMRACEWLERWVYPAIGPAVLWGCGEW